MHHQGCPKAGHGSETVRQSRWPEPGGNEVLAKTSLFDMFGRRKGFAKNSGYLKRFQVA
ncbi:hypothetical protein HMPREF9371_1570 [Neisseria shayeganii 871]|uniref:Uncharacterized protein n=1 Tax=Neisseria shayeganii 871 TaxID=1032488 RepID=G4CIY1_9NEIS|nr:hypothetical protein HMPREF9371_1570 [Neisseria shayeganii 871]